MKNAPRRFGRNSLRKLLQMGKKRNAARHRPNFRRFESLEDRLMLHGDNGPHDVDPNYDPSQFFHIHADLAIYVDSELVALPGDIGIFSGELQSFLHTHDGDPNQLHLEPGAAQPTDFVTLGDFFDLWRTNAGDPGNNPNAILTDTQLFDNMVDDTNTLQAYVNGERLEDHFADYRIHDGDNIVLTYGSNPVVTFDTNAGNVPVLLLKDEAPNTVDNFLRYVNGGVDGNGYVGSVFHRNDQGFVLQGGGFRPTSLTTTDLNQIQGPFNSATGNFEHHIPTFSPIGDERGAGDRSNTLGTLAMAKNSAGATSEFFYNVADNSFLDSQGFTVFAIALGSAKPDATPVPTAPVNLITGLTNVDVDPSNDGSGAFSVFDNVPYTADGEMVAFEAFLGEGLVLGTSFNDLNANGARDAGEPGLQSFTVYSDANNNGVLDAGEVSDTTDANGNYQLRLANGTHTIRQMTTNGFSQTSPNSPNSYSVTVEVDGELQARDFGNVGVATPAAVDLVAAADSGVSSADNRTNFNNSSAAAAPQFTVSGVTSGATVQIRVDGTLVGEQIASSDSVTITLDGATALADGTHQVSAVQSIDGAFGNPTTLTIEIDTSGPTFSSTAPTTAIAEESFTYDAATDDEAGDGASYVIVDPTTGEPVAPVVGAPVINPVTGAFAWTPGLDDIGSHDFAIRATDQTGNPTVQTFTVDVLEPPVIRFRLDVTKGGQPISANNLVKTGDEILLSVFVDDVRTLSNPAEGGVFSAYLDVLYDSTIVSVAGPITYGSIYTEGLFGNTSTPGLIDAAGAFSGQLSPVGQGEQFLWSVPLTVVGSGTVMFVGEPTTDPNDPGDVGQTPQFDAGVYNAGDTRYDDPIGPSASPSFGTMQFVDATVNVDAKFGIVNLEFQPEEDSTDNPIAIADVTSNPENLSLTFVGTPTAQHGTVTIAGNSTQLLYTPNANFTGTDVISFSVTDGEDTLDRDQEIFVFNLNDPPTAVDDTQDVDEDTQEPVFIDVLSNDLADPDPVSEKDRFRVTAVQTTTAKGGTVTIAGVGLGVTYLPPANFIGEDTFTYTMSDRDPVDPQLSTATVTVTVKDINDPPVANADRFGDSPDLILEDSTNNVLLVLANDTTGPDQGETLSIVAGGFTQPAHGMVTLSDSEVRYTPNADFFGEDTFTYTITDNHPTDPRTATGTVVVVVSNTNDNPTANADPDLRVTQNTTGNSLDVLANDSSAPDPTETLTITGVSDVTTGFTVSVAADGKSVIYAPPTDFLGTDTFTYTIIDGNGGTASATATVEVVTFIPGSLSGFVYVDANDNGIRETSERVLEGVTITLTGTDIFGAVNKTIQTNADGAYTFGSLAPGDYVITQTQPAENLDGDGIPLLDGRDTIGSQGGTAGKNSQDNDTFTVTLAEGVDGTGNNFGEIKGRTVNVSVLPFDSQSALAGFDVKLLQDGQVMRDSVFTDSSGHASFVGLTPGTYKVQVSGPFLLNGSSEFVIGDQGAFVDVSIGEPEIDPIYPTYLDSLSSRSTEFVNVAVGATAQHWLALGAGWQDVQSIQVQMEAGGNGINLTLVDSDGTYEGTIPKTNGLLNVLNQLPDGTSRIRLNGTRAEFKALLTPANTSGGAGEGEGAAFAAARLPAAKTSIAPNDAHASNQPAMVQPVLAPPVPVAGTTLDAAPVAGDLLITGLEFGEGESRGNPDHPSHDAPADHRAATVDVLFAGAANSESPADGNDLSPLGAVESHDLLNALEGAFADGGFIEDLGAPLVQ